MNITTARRIATLSTALVSLAAASCGGGGSTADAPIAADAPASPLCQLTSETRTTASQMEVVHHDGQSFVSWRDRAIADAGADIRYRVYRARTPITSDADLASAELITSKILNHSGQLFGSAFKPAQRVVDTAPMALVENNGTPLPTWSGLWVANASDNGCAYFAVLATDKNDVAMETIEPGRNATTAPIAEALAPHQPIKVYDSANRGQYSPNTKITGTPNLPLSVILHASNAQGGGAGDYGDYYEYFGDTTMGYRAGLPGVFSVEETHSGPQTLMMRNRDTIVMPDGMQSLETYWFGYVATPEWGDHARHAYPFTEARLLYMIPWVISRYQVDPERVTATGGSMGAWGSVSFAFRHPELFAAVFPDRPRLKQIGLTSITTAATATDTLPSGQLWSEHHNAIAFATGHPAALPFLGWNCGRNDGFATWAEQVEMVQAMTAAHHGFAFAWNNGDHSTGSIPNEVAKWYPASRFAKHLSYPAFGHSSIDNNLGNGSPTDGDLVGGINLGFSWTDPVESATSWSSAIGNALNTSEMTVDVTPRRPQMFQPAAGSTVHYTTSLGQAGDVVVDGNGIVTVPAVRIAVGAATTVTLTR